MKKYERSSQMAYCMEQTSNEYYNIIKSVELLSLFILYFNLIKFFSPKKKKTHNGEANLTRYKSEECAGGVSFPWHLKYFPTLFVVWNLLL